MSRTRMITSRMHCWLAAGRNTGFVGSSCAASFVRNSSSSSPREFVFDTTMKRTFSSMEASPPQIRMDMIFVSPKDDDSTEPEIFQKPCIVHLILDRPKAANAMGRQLVWELGEFIGILEAIGRINYQVRCVVISSSSPKVFSAGADLKERADMNEEETEAFVGLLRDTFQRLADLPMPTIAALEGVAVGGGLELALATDIRIASFQCKLGLPETTLGILPGAGGTQRLSRLVGLSKAKELIWTGKSDLSGIEALEIGLVDRLTRPDERSVVSVALELAHQIAANGPIAIRASKEAMEKGMQATTMTEALKLEAASYARVIPTDDRKEGLAAFREKRTPQYKGE